MTPDRIKEQILFNIDVSTSAGVEIGPLANPLVKKSDGDVRYIDRESTENIKEWYRNADVVDQDKIVEVDYIWGDKSLSESTGVVNGFDYCIAAHVLEHVPDLIGWLREISSILKDNGIASFSIPDRRFTFDYLRTESTVAEVLDAYFKKSRQPTIRQIFDHFSLFTEINIVDAWQPAFDGKDLTPAYGLTKAYAYCLDAVNKNKYIDTHCWIFTSKYFLDVLKVLSQLDLIDFKIRAFFDVVPNAFEFVVQLEKIPSSFTPEEKHEVFLESLQKVHPHILRISFQSSSAGIAQVYFDSGNGFNEQESVSKGYSVDGGMVCLDFSLPRVNIKALRFDPLMGPVRCTIVKMEFLPSGDEDNAVVLNSFKPGKNIRKSGIRGGCFFVESKSKTNDPNIMIDLPREVQGQL